jgi:hypothetical protein
VADRILLPAIHATCLHRCIKCGFWRRGRSCALYTHFLGDEHTGKEGVGDGREQPTRDGPLGKVGVCLDLEEGVTVRWMLGMG